jgi:hypothetical protein
MPSTRRAVLAAAVLTAAGCTDGSSSASTTEQNDTSGTATGAMGTETEATTGTGTPPADGDVPVHWRHETPHERLGLVTLAPGSDGPPVYVGSAAGPSSSRCRGSRRRAPR